MEIVWKLTFGLMFLVSCFECGPHRRPMPMEKSSRRQGYQEMMMLPKMFANEVLNEVMMPMVDKLDLGEDMKKCMKTSTFVFEEFILPIGEALKEMKDTFKPSTVIRMYLLAGLDAEYSAKFKPICDASCEKMKENFGKTIELQNKLLAVVDRRLLQFVTKFDKPEMHNIYKIFRMAIQDRDISKYPDVDFYPTLMEFAYKMLEAPANAMNEMMELALTDEMVEEKLEIMEVADDIKSDLSEWVQPIVRAIQKCYRFRSNIKERLMLQHEIMSCHQKAMSIPKKPNFKKVAMSGLNDLQKPVMKMMMNLPANVEIKNLVCSDVCDKTSNAQKCKAIYC